MTQVLLRGTVPENYDRSFRFVVLDLTPEVVKGWLDRIQLVKELKAKDNMVLHLEYWDCSPTWALGTDQEDYLGSEKFDEIDAAIGDDFLILPEPLFKDDFNPSGYNDDSLRTECERMAVDDHEIRWMCYEKHCDIELGTCRLGIETLLCILDDMENRPVPTACICTKKDQDDRTFCRWCWKNGRKAYYYAKPEPEKMEDKT